MIRPKSFNQDVNIIDADPELKAQNRELLDLILRTVHAPSTERRAMTEDEVKRIEDFNAVLKSRGVSSASFLITS